MPAATYEFNTSLLQDINKATRDIVIFLDHMATFGLNATRWEVDGRRVTSGTIVFTTNVELPPHYIYALDITHTPGTLTYSLTTALLADIRKASDDMQVLFDHIVQGYVLQSISIDNRTLANGVVQVTLNDIAPVSMVFGLDVTRVA